MPEAALDLRDGAGSRDTVPVSVVARATPTVATAAPSSVRRRLTTVARAPLSGRAWRANAYVLVAAPLPVPGAVVVVVSTVLGLGLAITLLGLPLLALGGAVAIRIGGWHRGLAAALLGVQVPGAPRVPRGRGIVGRSQACFTDGVAWRARLYLVLKLPVALVSLYAVFVVYYVSAVLALYPVWFAVSPAAPSAARAPTGVLALGALIGQGATPTTTRASHRLILHIGGLHLDRWPLVIAACVIGLVGLLGASWLSWLAARFDVALMRRLLGPTRGSLRVAQLEAARSVVAEDLAATLRRIERDLHDGTQAQLVALAIKLGSARDRLNRQPVADRDPATVDLITSAHDQTKDALDELRNIARGIHPPALDVGLEPALETLTARSAVPATLSVSLDSRPTDAIGTIAYYAVAELLTNVAKHAEARTAAVALVEDAGVLVVTVSDDGHGGAEAGRGTGLTGLAARLGAVDGSLAVDSPAGGPTVATVRLPVRM